MASPRVVAEAPAGWVGADIERPAIAENSGARLVQWEASRSVREETALVAGCVATPIPGWVEDMRPAVEARTVALAGAVASKITGGPIDARGAEDRALVLRAANDLGAAPVGRARTFIGFDHAHVVTCFATCATTSGTSLPRSDPWCERLVAGARLEGSRPPPRPGLGLRAATWAVHHPGPVALGGFGLVVLFGVLAVLGRRRPRSRIGAG